MVIWGGASTNGPYNRQFSTGGRYDPATDTWLPTSQVNAPEARDYHSSVWTGHEMIVWGGVNSATFVNTGARYDPSSDTWTPMTTVNAPVARYGHAGVWT